MQTKLMLMHTMEGKPAYYVPGEQIVFAARSRKMPVQLCESMAQIRAERAASRKWRKQHGFEAPMYREGFVYVEVPA